MINRAYAVIITSILLVPLLSSSLEAQTTERHILLEEYSTARCGFCPDGTIIAAQIVQDHPSVIWVTHHAGFGVDSMTTPESVAIASAFTNFAPGACIDRGVYPEHVSPYINQYGKIATTRSKWDSVVTAHLGDEQYAEIDITSSYDAGSTQLDITVDIVFSTAPAPGDIRVNLFIVEDSVVGYGEGYDQKNYYNASSSHPLYQAGDPIVGYAHHRVVSAVPTGDWGVADIIPPHPVTGTTYSYSWSGPLTEIWDPSNMDHPEIISFVAFISYYDDDPLKRQVIHAAEAHLTNVSSSGSLPEAATSLSVEAFPNPAGEDIRFITMQANATDGQLQVTDFAGRVVATYHVPRGTQRFRLSTRHLPAGMYYYRLTASSEQPAAGKILVIR
jgi:hypothetical protein